MNIPHGGAENIWHDAQIVEKSKVRDWAEFVEKSVGVPNKRFAHSDFQGLGGIYSSAHTLIGQLRASSVLSGWSNSIDGGAGLLGQLDAITIAGGKDNKITANYDGDSRGSFIGGGFSNRLDGYYSTIAGGKGNLLNGDVSNYGFIGGGDRNKIKGKEAFLCVISGGRDNEISGDNTNRSVISGGAENKITGNFAARSVISGGEENLISGLNAYYSSLGGGKQNKIAGQKSGFSCINGGQENEISGSHTTHCVIGGGEHNKIEATTAHHSVIVGGRENELENNAAYSVISGGYKNVMNGQRSFIGSGFANKIDAVYGTQNVICGGNGNEMRSTTIKNSIIAGGFANIIGLSASGTALFGVSILGGEENVALGSGSTVVGGKGLEANSFREVVKGQYNDSNNPTGIGVPSKNQYVDGQIAESLGIGTDANNRKNAYAWLKNGKQIRYNTPVYADNAAAIAGGELTGTVYRKPTGELMEVF